MERSHHRGAVLDPRHLLRAGRTGDAEAAMSRLEDWLVSGREVSVAGLARSGTAAARLLLAHGLPVYVSDSGDTDVVRAAADALRAESGVLVGVDTGGHDLGRVRNSSGLILSPGIP